MQKQPLNAVEEDCPRSEITKQPILAWRSTRDTLDGLSAPVKRVINAIKTYISETQSAIWYHNENCDSMSLFGGRHLHIITFVDNNLDGSNRQLYNNTRYRNLRKILVEHEGYMKSQQVRDLQKLCQHLSCPPRMYMGSRDHTVGKLMQHITPSAVDYNVCISDIENYDENPEAVAGNSEWNLDPIETITSTNDPWAPVIDVWNEPVENVWSQTVAIAEKGHSELLNVKRTFQDKVIDICKFLTAKFNVDSHEQLSLKIADLPDADPIKLRWNTLQHRPGIAAKIASVAQQNKTEHFNHPLETLIDHFMTTADHSQYTSMKNSLNIWFRWCHSQSIDPAELLWEIAVVFDRILPKRNCLSFIGRSNAGKTVIISQPLCEIARYVGRVCNVNVANQFAWQDCVNVRLISIEEALFAPEQLDKFKQIAGGETCTADKKFFAPVNICRTPVILTANHYPWRNATDQRQPLQNRMFLHEVQPTDWLVNMTKPLHPGIYKFLFAAARRIWQEKIPIIFIPFTLDVKDLQLEIEQWSPPETFPFAEDDDDDEPLTKKQQIVTECDFE